MRRRDFVKGVVALPVVASTALGQQAPSPLSPPPPSSPPPSGAAPVAPPAAAPAPAPSLLRGMGGFKAPPVASVVPDVIAVPELHFFTESQLAALRRLGDLLIPPLNGYPGALQAQAPEFLDFLIGASPSEIQLLYRQGLDHLNTEAKMQFGKSFAELNAGQADKVVRPGLLPYVREHPPAAPFPRFIAIAHDDLRTATMNSEAWNVAAVSSGERAPGVGMFWRPIDPDPKNWA